MATNFPTSLDSLTNPTSSSTLNNPDHAGQHSDANDAIEALQTKVGVNGSAITTSLDYKVTNGIHSALNVDSGTLYVDATNNRVGVNDTTPSYSLDVTGNGHFTTDLTVDGTSATSVLTVDGIEIDTTGASSNLVLKYNGTKFLPTAETSSSGASYVVYDDVDQPNAPDKWVAVSEIRQVTWTGSSWSVGSVIDRVGPSGPGYTMVGTARQPLERFKVIPYNQIINHNICATAATLTSFGSSTASVTGTQSAVVAAQNSPNADRLTSAATASATAGVQSAVQITCIGSATDWAVSGFDVRFTLRFNDSSYDNTGASTGSRIAVGLSSSGSIATVLATDNLANSFVGFVRRHVNGGSTDTYWTLLCRTGAAGPTTYTTSVQFYPQKWYTLRLWMAPGGSDIGWEISNHTDGTTTNGIWTPSSNLPASSTMLSLFAGLLTVNATARAVDVSHISLVT
jgi:hypothetical protein